MLRGVLRILNFRGANAAVRKTSNRNMPYKSEKTLGPIFRVVSRDKVPPEVQIIQGMNENEKQLVEQLQPKEEESRAKYLVPLMLLTIFLTYNLCTGVIGFFASYVCNLTAFPFQEKSVPKVENVEEKKKKPRSPGWIV